PADESTGQFQPRFFGTILGLRHATATSTSSPKYALISTANSDVCREYTGRSRRMMHSRSLLRWGLMGLAMAILMMLAPTEAAAKGPLHGTTYPSKITTKLWSGISNTLFCWVEIPIEINREIQSTDPFTGFFVGAVKGIWYTGRRLVLGVVDIF